MFLLGVVFGDRNIMELDVLIIGSGPAGYTAAIYASRAGRKTELITGQNEGGQLMITLDIENYPGFAHPISGPELMANMKKQAENLDIKMHNDTVISVDLSGNRFSCICESGNEYISKTLIIATGASARWLNVEGEKEYIGRGVSACATCDGFFFRNKDVAVIGGGNTAVEEAIFLTNFAKSVILIHRRGSLKAEKIMQERLMANPKIKILWNSVIEKITGDNNKVTQLSLINTTDGNKTEINIDGVFVAIGHQPATSIFKGKIDLDENGHIITSIGNTSTSVRGVFAAGDVCDPHYRQAITSAAQGCMAAIDADRFLTEIEE